MNNEKFRQAAANILTRDKERVRGMAKAELGAWEEEPERRMELFVLRKILIDRKSSGRGLEWLLESYSDKPHPLDVFLAVNPCPPGLISRYLEESRRHLEQLRAWAGEGDRGMKNTAMTDRAPVLAGLPGGSPAGPVKPPRNLESPKSRPPARSGAVWFESHNTRKGELP